MEVFIERKAKKTIKLLPKNVKTKLSLWITSVEMVGLEETRKIPGFHDEPLSGKKKSRRSIRLNKAWRAEYKVEKDSNGKYVLVLEVHHHDY